MDIVVVTLAGANQDESSRRCRSRCRGCRSRVPTSTPNRAEAMVEKIDPIPSGVDLFQLKPSSHHLVNVVSSQAVEQEAIHHAA